ncbi:MAG: radical SAM/SPASM domain-containing protein [Chloroflexota bacterium]
MLQVRYDKQQHELFFPLNQRLPAELSSHEALGDFLKLFRTFGGQTHVTGDDDSLVSLSIGIDNWRKLLNAALPPREARFHADALQGILSSDRREPVDGLQVNFHQKSFDTPARYWSFLLQQGHFTRYFFNRVGWISGPEHRIVSPFPLHVDIETASTCNMNCPMCYRRMLKESGLMAPDLFYRIVDECAEQDVYSVRLSWRGEALTHPRIKELVAYACKRIPNVSFLTNAFFVNESMAHCFIENGVSYVAVSFDGIGETYEKIRAPAKFEENRARLAKLRELREAAGAGRPQVRLCTVWPAIKDEPEAYYEAMSPVSDYIVYNPYINFTGPMEVKPAFICQYPWERLVVAFNGDTQCCTGWNATDIILGNARDRSLKEMWHSPKMNRVREIHAAGGRMQLEACAACRHGSRGDEDAGIDEIIARRW